MKRILLVVIAIMLFAFPAAENIDISELSTDELLELGKKLNAALRESDEWQSVVVPTGVYKVGVDIPAETISNFV